MSQLIERLSHRRPHKHESHQMVSSRMEQTAEALRPHWWNNAIISPWFDVGIFRLTDPRPASQNIELTTLAYDTVIKQLQGFKRDPQPQIDERNTFIAFVQRKHIRPYARALDLHIPPRPPESVRTLAADLTNSAAQLAGWIEAYNCYHPEKPVGLLTGRTSLAGSKRVASLGFEHTQIDRTPWPAENRLDIIEHLVQNPHLKAEDLLQAPLWTLLASRRTFSRTHHVHRYNNRAFTLHTDSGHTIELPHEGNGWQLWLQHTGNSLAITDHDAQVLRGAIQVATAVAHDAGADIRIRVPDVHPFQPFLERTTRSIGPWGLYRKMGTPVRSFGYPSLEFIAAFISDIHEPKSEQ